MIANPAPLKSSVTWYGPTESIKVTTAVIKRDADYKYNIRGAISIDNEQRIGNYTMLYDGKEIITIIIHAIKGLSFSFLFSFIYLFHFFFVCNHYGCLFGEERFAPTFFVYLYIQRHYLHCNSV